MDFKTVFLNGDINETIYIVQLVNFVSNESKSRYLHETKRFLTKNLQMKDLGETSFVLGIQILKDHFQGILRLHTCSLIESLKVWRSLGTLTLILLDGKIANTLRSDTSTCSLNELSLGSLLWVVDDIKRLLKIYCDNNSIIIYSNNNKSSTKSKFIDIKFFERVQNKQIFIKHIGTSFMLADPLTKGLIPKVFHEHTAHMSNKVDVDIRSANRCLPMSLEGEGTTWTDEDGGVWNDEV
ncbi:hypothetical protein CR513_29106, partial [Mucuna pruriens]